MLRNEPPPGTQVRFTKQARKVAAYEIATLVGPLQKYYEDRSDDLFIVSYRGERITVTRAEIEETQDKSSGTV
jgi:hypothetical protein